MSSPFVECTEAAVTLAGCQCQQCASKGKCRVLKATRKREACKDIVTLPYETCCATNLAFTASPVLSCSHLASVALCLPN